MSNSGNGCIGRGGRKEVERNEVGRGAFAEGMSFRVSELSRRLETPSPNPTGDLSASAAFSTGGRPIA